MTGMMIHLGSRFLLMIGRILSCIVVKVKIVDAQNVPRNEPLIVVSNHFSWFDGPLLTMWLPVQPSFLIATESTRFWYWRLFVRLYNCIPIWRGRVDRRALQAAINVLRSGGVIGVFPEGGIEPGLAERRERGELIQNVIFARANPELARARPGVAFLAVESEVRILPVALTGTEKIWENLRRFRRTPVTIKIGEVFGPLKLTEEASGRVKREQLDGYTEMTMRHIASLFPPDKRGPYGDVEA
jgi:1-acyl-sn-glycerol-3-phosphate acyltransferase